MAALDIIIEKVTAQNSIIASVVTLLQELSQKLKDCAGDPVKIAELAAQIEANTDALSVAVQENTPVA